MRGDETLLLVEDDDEVLAIIGSLLHEFGYTGLVARNGLQALEMFRQNSAKIKLVILDAIMPLQSGWETFRAIQTEAPGIKALFISGYMKEALVEKGLIEETSLFLSKPIASLDLLSTVREELD